MLMDDILATESQVNVRTIRDGVPELLAHRASSVQLFPVIQHLILHLTKLLL